MPAAPAPSSSRLHRAVRTPPRQVIQVAWPVALLVALAALSWGAVSSFPIASGPLAVQDAMHLVAPTSSEAPRDAVLPSARPVTISALRAAADAVFGGTTSVSLLGSWGVVVVLAAVVLVRDGRERWWARMVGAPPVLDVHLV